MGHDVERHIVVDLDRGLRQVEPGPRPGQGERVERDDEGVADGDVLQGEGGLQVVQVLTRGIDE